MQCLDRRACFFVSYVGKWFPMLASPSPPGQNEKIPSYWHEGNEYSATEQKKRESREPYEDFRAV